MSAVCLGCMHFSMPFMRFMLSSLLEMLSKKLKAPQVDTKASSFDPAACYSAIFEDDCGLVPCPQVVDGTQEKLFAQCSTYAHPHPFMHCDIAENQPVLFHPTSVMGLV